MSTSLRAANAARLLFLAASGFAAFTAAWIVVGVANNGDAFPQGLAVPLLPLLALGPAFTVRQLRRNDSKRRRIFGLIAASAAVAFWVLVPNGWWAIGPR